MSFILGGHKRIHPTQEGLLLKKFENHCFKVSFNYGCSPPVTQCCDGITLAWYNEVLYHVSVQCHTPQSIDNRAICWLVKLPEICKFKGCFMKQNVGFKKSSLGSSVIHSWIKYRQTQPWTILHLKNMVL